MNIDNEKFTLVGFVNAFNVMPHKIVLVFADKEYDLYEYPINCAEKEEDKIRINQLTPLSKKYAYDNVNYFEEYTCIKADIKDEYSIGDISVMGFQIDNDFVYIGRIDKYIEFITNYRNKLNKEENRILYTELTDDINNYGFIKEYTQEQLDEMDKTIEIEGPVRILKQ